MMASAAGLKTFAERERMTYLLNTAATETAVVTYHGSCGRRTMAVIIAVRTAPLGNSRRMTASTSPAATTALSSPGAMARIPSWVAAMPMKMARMTISRPFGVRKNRRRPVMSRRTTQAPGLEGFEAGRKDQAFDPHPFEKLDACRRTHHEGRSGKCVGQHG